MTRAELLSVSDARALICARLPPLPSETVATWQAAGRVLAADVAARFHLPTVDNSAMDGFGVRAVDVASASPAHPVPLRVFANAFAGSDVGAALQLPPEHAVQITTGAPIPPGVDAVVMRESCSEVDLATGTVRVMGAATVGQHVRKRGEDVAAGDRVGVGGTRITPARMNLLLAAGITNVGVARAPRVAILASGDELIDVDDPRAATGLLAPGTPGVVNSNAYAVAAAVRSLGCEVTMLGIAQDTLADHVARLRIGLGHDVLISIGGVSVGVKDFVRPALAALGVDLHLWRVAMRPGKPVAFGSTGSTHVFGLPGNPVSALVSMWLFVEPALRALQGDAGSAARRTGLLTGSFHKKAGLEHFARAVVTQEAGATRVRLLQKQGSHHMSALAEANALAVFPADVENVADGEPVELIDIVGQ